jgi:hypothetical protein
MTDSHFPRARPAIKTAIAILSAALNSGGDIGVGYKMPQGWARVYVRVDRAGGHRPVLVTDATRVLCEIYGPQVADVEPVAAQAIQALQNAQGNNITVDGETEPVFIRGFDNIEGPVDLPLVDVPDVCRWQFQGDLLVSTS